MDSKSLEQKLQQAQQELADSLAAEMRYSAQAAEHRACMADPALTFHQREAHQRAMLQYVGQQAGQRTETCRVRLIVSKLQRAIQEERDLHILSDEVLLARLKAQQPVALTAEQEAGMDESMEAAL